MNPLTPEEWRILKYYLSRSCSYEGDRCFNDVAIEAKAGNGLAIQAMEVRRKIVEEFNPALPDNSQ